MAVSVSVGDYVLLLVAMHAGIWTMWPVALIVWSPNIACALLAGALVTRGLKQPPLYGETEISR